MSEETDNEKAVIEIPGMRRFDWGDAVKCDEFDIRMLIDATFKNLPIDGTPYDFSFSSTGDTMILALKHKKTGRREVYDLAIRAHYRDNLK